MKLTSDDARYALNQVVDAANLLEISLIRAKRLLEREDLPKPYDRFDAAAECAEYAESEIAMAGDVGRCINKVVDTLEELSKELPNE